MNEERATNQMRSTRIEPFATAAAGSVVIAQGRTRVLCTASIADEPPKWIERDEGGAFVHGWVTAEYNMLPASTPERKRRGGDSRGTEIQRLIGRSLRAAVDLKKMPGLAITCDCDVLQADGGTRTASITGAWVALAVALQKAKAEGRLSEDPLASQIAAISVGVVDGQVMLDLDYERDVAAEVDLNVVMNSGQQFVELQGTGEKGTFGRGQLDAMLDLAAEGIEQLMAVQREAVASLTA